MTFEIYDVALVPIIMGVVQVFKQIGLPKRFSPLLALLLGIAGGIFYVCPTDIKSGIMVGIVLGLSATGLYSGSKNMIEK
ncbi:putative membrane protein YGL010W [Cerasibacillus quisquiliarum]|uniref:Holin n=1 Tax=Cerasibacillus quisquiliarum TaxID=227865 RepID=A0A511UUD1_9BACI|nr:hypothetical protein [Cerasibacillus quisquiliarum]MBB5144906.1 putative membrane protein YGL010W [Cerasibacillus quisquiliarum]GEN30199.1 holin [Cerasibacillus quisquiliarum]